MTKKRIGMVVGVFLLLLAVVGFFSADRIRQFFFRPTDTTIQEGATKDKTRNDIEIAAQDLTVPWGIAFLPDGDILVSERPGTLLRIGKNKQTFSIEGVEHTSEGGLMGIALDPKYKDNNRIYLYMTTRTDNGLENRIERYELMDDRLSAREVILEGIPGAANHDGGRIAFGPDGYLYVTTGDAGNADAAQDTGSLAGKILRLTADGEPAPGNPFGNAVFSYGHRNPQGIAWDSNGRLWSTEHGRSGLASGYDEVNLIHAGANYGWPVIQGDETRSGMESPVVHSGPDETWAPASLAYAGSSLYFAGLRGETLYEARLAADNSVSLTAHFKGEYGRLRTVAAKGDALYFTTSNTDGRGTPRGGDDKLIRIKLSALR